MDGRGGESVRSGKGFNGGSVRRCSDQGDGFGWGGGGEGGV